MATIREARALMLLVVSNWHHALQGGIVSGPPKWNYDMNYHNYEIGPRSAPDTGHEPVANHASFSFAGYTHQQGVLGDKYLH